MIIKFHCLVHTLRPYCLDVTKTLGPGRRHQSTKKIGVSSTSGVGGNEREVPEHRRLQKILSNKKGSLSQLYKKNTGANAKVFDFNQKTMQALETLAAVGDGRAVMEEFNEAQHNQERTRGVLHDSRESLENAFVVFTEACRGLEDAGKMVAETKRKADEAHDQIRAHRDRCSRVSVEYGTPEEDLNECGTHGPAHTRHCWGNTCVVMRHDGPGNEVRYFQKTLDVIKDFQRRGARREVADNILFERQR